MPDIDPLIPENNENKNLSNILSSKPKRDPLPKGFMPIWVTVLIDLLGFGIALPVLGIYAVDHFHANGMKVAFLGAAYSAAQAIASPILGKLSDKIGRKPVLIIALLGTCVTAAMTAFATSIWLLIVWRFLDGASGGTYAVATAAIADIAPPKRRSALMGMMGAAFGIGFTLGPAIGALASLIGGPRAPFFLLSGLAALNAIAVFVRVSETKGSRSAEEQNELSVDGGGATNWRQAKLPILFSVGAITTFAFASFETHFSTFGRLNLALTQHNAGYALAVVGIVSTIVQGGLIRPVSAKFGDFPLAFFGMLTTSVGLFMFARSAGWALLLPSMVVLAAGQGFASPTLSASIANRINANNRGHILGIQKSWESVASVIGPLAGGFAFDHIGHRSPFYFGGALFGVAALLFAFSRARRKAT